MEGWVGEVFLLTIKTSAMKTGDSGIARSLLAAEDGPIPSSVR